jgi:hypothetical protein
MASLQKPLNIHIPVKLAQIRVAFSAAALAFERDLRASIFNLQLINKNTADSKAKRQVLYGLSHKARDVALNDDTHNQALPSRGAGSSSPAPHCQQS